MFGKTFVNELIDRSTENPKERRRFLQAAGVAGLGVVGASVLGTGAASADPAPNDGSILNFALNLEYLEAEFYARAVTGKGLPDDMTDGLGGRGPVTGGRKVPFKTRAIQQYAYEIYRDEFAHVRFLRQNLAGAKVGRPKINLQTSFTAAARAAGLITSTQTFDPYANENNFLLAAYIFEDVGVTAYKGAAPLINNKVYLEAAAGILAAEAYHAAAVRVSLLSRGLGAATNKISAARDSLDGPTDLDQGTYTNQANITPLDANGIAFSRTPAQVLNIVYLNPNKVTKGGFFPAGVNGALKTSGGSSS